MKGEAAEGLDFKHVPCHDVNAKLSNEKEIDDLWHRGAMEELHVPAEGMGNEF